MDKPPKISVCVPNLNTRPYLPARFESIFNQTFSDWELIVCDSFSDDGSWEYIQELAAREPRMKICQTPRQGVYAGFNDCITRARGEYVYIATSDDTMTSDCLAKLAAALDQNPECGIAHCCLDFIDEQGKKISGGHDWDNWFTTRFFGDWNKKSHIRPRGHDSIVALGLRTVYYSVTQILIRRTVFDDVGLFQRKWGSFGDLEWQMRAALTTKTVHVPEYLATWRVHPQQASQIEHHHKAVRAGWFLEIADSAIAFSRDRNLPITGGLSSRLRSFYGEECIDARLSAEDKLGAEIKVLAREFRLNPWLTLRVLARKFRTRVLKQNIDPANNVRDELKRAGLTPQLGAK